MISVFWLSAAECLGCAALARTVVDTPVNSGSDEPVFSQRAWSSQLRQARNISEVQYAP